jgi:hypothetical protein
VTLIGLAVQKHNHWRFLSLLDHCNEAIPSCEETDPTSEPGLQSKVRYCVGGTRIEALGFAPDFLARLLHLDLSRY